MPDFGPEAFQARTGVSRETLDCLKIYADLLRVETRRHNLVAESTLPQLWERHFWDSAQVSCLIPADARTLVDLGSGAGFPGLVLALLRPELAVTLYEATGKKCQFLQAAAAAMGVTVAIENCRAEAAAPRVFDVVTARAVAPLFRLLSYARRFMGPNSVCLCFKGQNVGSELTEAHKYWNMRVSQIPSQTDPSARIVMVRELDCRDAAKTSHSGPGQPKGRGR